QQSVALPVSHWSVWGWGAIALFPIWGAVHSKSDNTPESPRPPDEFPVPERLIPLIKVFGTGTVKFTVADALGVYHDDEPRTRENLKTLFDLGFLVRERKPGRGKLTYLYALAPHVVAALQRNAKFVPKEGWPQVNPPTTKVKAVAAPLSESEIERLKGLIREHAGDTKDVYEELKQSGYKGTYNDLTRSFSTNRELLLSVSSEKAAEAKRWEVVKDPSTLPVGEPVLTPEGKGRVTQNGAHRIMVDIKGVTREFTHQTTLKKRVTPPPTPDTRKGGLDRQPKPDGQVKELWGVAAGMSFLAPHIGMGLALGLGGLMLTMIFRPRWFSRIFSVLPRFRMDHTHTPAPKPNLALRAA
ncbi:MAG TPA: hypothetical protein VKC60_08145, partial [Opitutaceae bacterium]|nr:hypothetical protein [Opitutaceae bacterium]